MIGIAIYISGIVTGIVATIAWVALVSEDSEQPSAGGTD